MDRKCLGYTTYKKNLCSILEIWEYLSSNICFQYQIDILNMFSARYKTKASQGIFLKASA
jgi:hypothetical protein